MTQVRPLLFAMSTIALATVSLLSPAHAQEDRLEGKFAIIKADDLKERTPKWDAFLSAAQAEDAKVTIGIICNSLEKPNATHEEWLKGLVASGRVEFWNHGWDHKQWKEGEKTLSEFGGSGYDHQKDHLTKSQEVSARVFGKPFAVLGTPFNAMDLDTGRVLTEIPEITQVFAYPGKKKELGGKTILPMLMRGEADGTGKPNSEKFIADYQEKEWSKHDFTAIQFHPNSFGEGGVEEFSKIIKFLKTEGWEFIFCADVPTVMGKK